MTRTRIAATGIALLLVAGVGAVQAAPAPAPAATQAAPGAQRVDGGWAVPISTRGPSWYDSAFYNQVLAAGNRGTPLPAGASLPESAANGPKRGSGGGSAAPTNSETAPGVERPPVGLGPGTWLISIFTTKGGTPTGFAWCTANFVFRSGTSFGLGTAGHCAPVLSNPVTAFVVPPPDATCPSGPVCAPGIYPIGKFSVVRNNGVGDDFALVSIDPAYNSWMRPTMPVFGGPTGVYTGGVASVPSQTVTAGPATVLAPSFTPAVLGHCGHGAVVGAGGTCRTSVGLFASGTAFAWYGPSFEGDSGSGVVVLGNPASPLSPVPAAADLTHIIILDAQVTKRGNVTVGPFYSGMIAGTQMTKILSILGSGWSLVPGGLP
ncbi:MAG TPA: hypothetical protein VKI64_08015 [Acidimicrobiales bacterium]|nr:hypothetical protein [Acidimicrobiales bacterium]